MALRHAFIIIIAIGFILPGATGSGYGADESWASLCRERAQRLRSAVQKCNERIARREIVSCTISLPYRQQAEISTQEAISLARAFEQRAPNFDGIEQQIKEEKSRIRQTQNAIRDLGFNKRAEDFEEWERLTEQARSEFKASVYNGLIDTSLTGLKEGTKALGSLGTGQGNKLIGSLKENGIDVPELNKAIQNISHMKEKPANAKIAGELIEAVKKAKDTVSMSKEKRDIWGKLKTIATVLGWLVKDPLLSVFVSEVDMTISSLYNSGTRWVAAYQIEKLSKLTELQMNELKTLSERMKGNVTNLKLLRQRGGALPVCK